MTVFVVQDQPKRDLSSAQRYGAIEYIFPSDRFQPSREVLKAHNHVEDFLRKFDPQTDYITYCGGDPLGNFLIGSALRGKNVRFLRWERERGIDGRRLQGSGYYVPVRIQL